MKYEWNERAREEKKEQQHMQADLYISVLLLLPKIFSYSISLILVANDQVSRAKLNKKSFKNIYVDSQKCVIRPQLHCVWIQKKTKYIFVIGVYFRLIDDSSSRNSLCDDRNVFKMYDVAKFLYCK